MYAAIDLGSNSFHFLLANVKGGIACSDEQQSIETVESYSDKVQLAKGLSAGGYMTEEAMQRGFVCLAEMRIKIQNIDVSEVRVVATYALRTAANASDFLRRAEQILGLPIDVLSGEEEAHFIYKGLQRSQKLEDSNLVVDVGGGSTEFAFGCEQKSTLLFSEPIGVVTLRERFFADNIIRRADYLHAKAYVARWVHKPAAQIEGHHWSQAWGTSGTMKAIARILNGLNGCGYIIEKPQLDALLEDVLSHGSVAALNYRGLNERRAPLLLSGIAIVSELMEELAIDSMKVSLASLREGVIWQMLDEVTSK